MAKEISAKGPMARKFGLTVRDVELEAEKGASTLGFRSAMKDLWVWVKDYTLLENEVIELREEMACLKAQVPAKEPETPGTIMAKETGPWFDSSRGIYIPAAIIQEAIDRGWKGAPECEGLTDEEMSMLDDYQEIADDAESWFNERAPKGYYFGTHPDHGDWGLWELEED